MGFNKREKVLLAGLIVAVLAAIGLLIGVIVLATKDDDEIPPTPQPNVCKTPECVNYAGKMMSNMNLRANHCTEFFEYACGGWINSNPIPETASSLGQFNILRDQLTENIRTILESTPNESDPEPVKMAQNFYTACIEQTTDNDGPKHLDLRTKIEAHLNKASLGLILSSIRRDLGGNYIFTTLVNLDEANSTNHIIYIDQLAFGLARQYILDFNETNRFRPAYKNLMTKIMQEVYLASDFDENAIDRIIAFETELANRTLTPEERRDRDRIYNIIDYPEVVEMFPPQNTLDFEAYIKDVYSEVDENIDFTGRKLIVRDLSFIGNLSLVLDNFSEVEVKNYLRWRISFFLANEVSQTLRNYVFEYQKETLGIQNPEARWKFCSDTANTFLGMAISRPYVNEHFDNDTIKNVNTMVDNIRIAFNGILNDLEWLDDETRVLAREKADKMNSFMAYPQWILNDTLLAEYYEGLTIGAENHVDNYLSAMHFSTRRSLRYLDQKKDTNRWNTDPTVVNAFYNSVYNSISFPAGILQMPFYGMPLEALNYGAIGAVIGHEITHGFDDRGRMSDGDGNLHDWWTEEIVEEFKNRAQCFVDQYGRFCPDIDGKAECLNGIQTQGENIADNGGLREAYVAYQQYVKDNEEEQSLPGFHELGISNEQLFFLGFGQIWCNHYKGQGLRNQILTGVHSPPMYRVLGTLQNSPEFANAWKCPAPQNPCRIW